MTDTSKPANVLPLGVSLQIAQDIGDRLRSTRERLNIGVNQISMRVKIRESYLESMESGRWHELPPGLNGRGLVRVYAKELGVTLAELEPQDGPKQTHPHYLPMAEVSVVSRKDFEQRVRAKGSDRDVRTRAGHVNPFQKVSSLPERKSYSPLGAGTVSPSQNRSTLGRLNEKEDESLLDVITPDVASILGIVPADLEFRKKPHTEQSFENEEIPQVNPESLVAELLGSGFEHSEPPQTQPISKLFSEPPHSKQTQVFVPESEDEVVLIPKKNIRFEEVLPQKTHYATTQVAATEYAKTEPIKTEQVKTQVEVVAPANKYVNEKLAAPMWRYFLVGAIVVIAGGGVFKYLNEQNAPLKSDEIVVPVSDASEVDSEVQEAGSAVAGGQMENASKTNGAENSPNATQVESASAVPAPESIKPQTVDTAPMAPVAPILAGKPETESTTGLQPASGVVEAVKKPVETSLVGTGGVREATLNISEDVEIQVTVDGKKVSDGLRERGEFKFSFSKKAEIFVSDGSKVKLKFGGWEHGVLGHPGRKRRLILNAESYGDVTASPR